jgi:RecA-family ATPase
MDDVVDNITRLSALSRRGGNGIDSSAVDAREVLIQRSADFTSNYVPPDYLIDGFLQHRYLYSFTGRTGEGKTAISLLLMANIALGRKIGDHDVDKGHCLMLAGENPDDVRARWIAMGQQHDFDINSIDVHFLPGDRRTPACACP